MAVKEDSFEDFLSGDEAEFVGRLMANLPNEQWAQTLLRDIQAAGGLTRANKAKFFELRFGYALRQAGIVPRYEVQGAVPFVSAFAGALAITQAIRVASREAPHTCPFRKLYPGIAVM